MLFLLVSLGVGCQPYPDHGDDLTDFRADWVEFGSKRRLALARATGDRQSLTLEFNQPIQFPAQPEKEKVPFELSFQPKIALKSSARIGAATVRMEFANELPPAHRYTAIIPSGWRALTGATLNDAVKVEWETERPELDSVKAGQGPDGEYWQLDFNQAIDLESLRSLLAVESSYPKKSTRKASSLSGYRLVQAGEATFHLYLPELESHQRFQLRVESGLKSVEGSLPGLAGEAFPLETHPAVLFLRGDSRWLPAEDTLLLHFSSPVSERELLRNLKGLQGQKVRVESADGRVYRLRFPAFKGVRIVTLLDDLKSLDGARLARQVQIEISRSQAGPTVASPRTVRGLQKVPGGSTRLARPYVAESSVSTWSLSDSEAAQLVGTPDRSWRSSAKLPLERGAPVFSFRASQSLSGTPFLDPKDGSGLFLVKIAGPKEVERILVQVTDITLHGWSLNGQAFAFIGDRSGAPVGQAEVELLNLKGQIVAQGMTRADGVVALGNGLSLNPFLAVARSSLGRSAAVMPAHQEVLEPDDGSLWLPSKVYRPGEKVSFFGLWWAPRAGPSLVLRDLAGQETKLSADLVAHPFFQGFLTAPLKAGRYQLVLGGTITSELEVSELAGMASGNSTLAFQGDGVRFAGHYDWRGPKAEQVGLRAHLVPVEEGVGGWTAVFPEVGNWIPLPVSTNRSLEKVDFTLGELPNLPGRWKVAVELYDQANPSVVLESQALEFGRSTIRLKMASGRVLALNERVFQFRFQERDRSAQDGRPLQCTLWKADPSTESGWDKVIEGQADFVDDDFRWVCAFKGSGTFRLECAKERGKPIAVWETRIDSAHPGESPDQLIVDPLVGRPGQQVKVRWMGLADRTPVWLSFLAGDQIVSVHRWSASGGDLGELKIPDTNPGQQELTLLAAKTPSNGPAIIRRQRLRLDQEAARRKVALELAGAESSGSWLTPSQTVQVRLDSDLKGVKSGVFWWSPVDSLSGQELATEGVQFPAKYPAEALPVVGPRALENLDSLSLAVPSEPGLFVLNFLGLESSGRLVVGRTQAEVKSGTHWEAWTPNWVRPGDQFAAGVRLWTSAAKAGPKGVTLSVEPESTLWPETYRTTTSVVKPGATDDLMFSYRLAEFIGASSAERVRLQWEFGLEGEAVQVSTELQPLPSPAREVSYRRLTLGPEQELVQRLSGLKYWRLRLLSSKGATVAWKTDQSESRRVSLKAGVEWETIGRGVEKLSLRNESGGAVEIHLSQLLPAAPNETRSSAGGYLLRSILESESLLPVTEALKPDSGYLVTHYLVTPAATERSELLAPLPGGLSPSATFLLERGQLKPLAWTLSESLGGVTVELPPLPAGEHRILTKVTAKTAGEYHWPASVWQQGEKRQGCTLSSTVSVRRP